MQRSFISGILSTENTFLWWLWRWRLAGKCSFVPLKSVPVRTLHWNMFDLFFVVAPSSCQGKLRLICAAQERNNFLIKARTIRIPKGHTEGACSVSISFPGDDNGDVGKIVDFKCNRAATFCTWRHLWAVEYVRKCLPLCSATMTVQAFHAQSNPAWRKLWSSLVLVQRFANYGLKEHRRNYFNITNQSYVRILLFCFKKYLNFDSFLFFDITAPFSAKLLKNYSFRICSDCSFLQFSSVNIRILVIPANFVFPSTRLLKKVMKRPVQNYSSVNSRFFDFPVQNPVLSYEHKPVGTL